MSIVKELAIVPREGLFCKDGRGWFTSSSGRGHCLDWPWPSTILGSVRTACGNKQESQKERPFTAKEWMEQTSSITLGRSIILRREYSESWATSHRVWPVPADAKWIENEKTVMFLNPTPAETPILGRSEEPEKDSLWIPQTVRSSKPLLSPRWWSERVFIDWLCAEIVSANKSTNESANEPRDFFNPIRRIQSHVGINPQTLAAEEGVLYSHDIIETIESGAEWSIGVEIVFQKEASDSSELHERFSTLGGDGRIVRFEKLPKETFEAPKKLLTRFASGSPGLRLVLATPGCFEGGWLPTGFSKNNGQYTGRLPGISSELILRAAYVGRPVHVSGWDMALGKPKPTSRMVPAGTVYFLEKIDKESFRDGEARELWLSSFGDRTSEGYGLVVPGIWHR